MFRKTLAAALTVAIIAGSAVAAATTASAANGRHFAATAVALAAGAAITSAVSNRGHGYEYSHRGYADDCSEKQITRWNSYGERVVGYKTICR